MFLLGLLVLRPNEVAAGKAGDKEVCMLRGIGKLVVGVVLVGVGVFGALAATGLAGDGLEEAVATFGNGGETGVRKAS